MIFSSIVHFLQIWSLGFPRAEWLSLPEHLYICTKVRTSEKLSPVWNKSHNCSRPRWRICVSETPGVFFIDSSLQMRDHPIP
jgi:hypothetical protein